MRTHSPIRPRGPLNVATAALHSPFRSHGPLSMTSYSLSLSVYSICQQLTFYHSSFMFFQRGKQFWPLQNRLNFFRRAAPVRVKVNPGAAACKDQPARPRHSSPHSHRHSGNSGQLNPAFRRRRIQNQGIGRQRKKRRLFCGRTMSSCFYFIP